MPDGHIFIAWGSVEVSEPASDAMKNRCFTLSSHDPVWFALREEAAQVVKHESLLTSVLQHAVLNQPSLERALSHLLSYKLATPDLPALTLRSALDHAFEESPDFAAILRADMVAIDDRDPACHGYLAPLLYYKGFHALQTHRAAHFYWHQHQRHTAQWLQNRASEVFAVDIHPAAQLGRGIFLDHGTGVVIGETAVVGDDVSLLHSVTLGGTGKQSGDRHPKIRPGVLIGAGAKILGHVVIGEGARIGAGSVVLREVPAHRTVVGVPARETGSAGCSRPSHEMNHQLPPLGDD